MEQSTLTNILILFNVSSLGLLAFLKFANPLRVNTDANRWFGVFLIFWASFWTDEISGFAGIGTQQASVQFLIRMIQYFTAMLFYISVLQFTRPVHDFRRGMLLHLILPMVYTVLLLIHLFRLPESLILSILLIVMMLAQTMFYWLLSFFRIRRHQRNLLNYTSDTRDVDLSWLENIIIVILLLMVFVVTYNLMFPFRSLNLFMNLIMTGVIYYVAYHSMRDREIFPFSEARRQEIIAMEEERTSGEEEEFRKKIMPDDELILQKTRLHQLMLKRKPYLDPDLNLVKLSEMLDTSTHRLSYIINAGYNENFFNFINRYRVDEAKALLKEPGKNQYSVLGIGFESGFNSKTSFNQTFRKFTGQTPSEYRKSGSAL